MSAFYFKILYANTFIVIIIVGQQKSGVGMNPNIPQMMPSLAQHLQQNLKVPIPRPQMGRQMIPMVRMSMMGHQQQQV